MQSFNSLDSKSLESKSLEQKDRTFKADEKTLFFPNAVKQIVLRHHPQAEIRGDAFIIKDQARVLKIVTKKLKPTISNQLTCRHAYGAIDSSLPRQAYFSTVNHPDRPAYGIPKSPEPGLRDGSFDKTLYEGIMLGLGHFFTLIFPLSEFKLIDSFLFLQINYIQGNPLDQIESLMAFEKNPENFVKSFAELTVFSKFLKNQDLYTDNVLVDAKGMVHGIDLVECGDPETAIDRLDYWQWKNRFRFSNNEFSPSPLSSAFVTKMQKYDDLYCQTVKETVKRVAAIIQSNLDADYLKDFLLKNKVFFEMTQYDPQKDLIWYYAARKYFLNFREKLDKIPVSQLKYEILYKGLSEKLTGIIEDLAISDGIYKNEDYIKLNFESEVMYHVADMNSCNVENVKFKSTSTTIDLSHLVTDKEAKDEKESKNRLEDEPKFSLVIAMKNKKLKINLNKLLVEKRKFCNELNHLLASMQPIFREYLIPAKVRKIATPSMEISYWSGDWQQGNLLIKHFYKLHYQRICEKLHYLAQKRCLTNKSKIRVLDLPCGQGDLAECLLPILCKLGFESVEVVLSDISKASIELAKKRLKPLVEQFKLLKLEFICASGIDRSLSGFDFIISCGGLLQREVVSSQEEALAFLNDFIKSLKPGGALFVCGLSESYISAHQMKKLGLQIDLIESSSRMSVQSCSDVTYENFYIVSKPKSPLVALSLLRQEQQESLNENRDINQPGVTNS